MALPSGNIVDRLTSRFRQYSSWHKKLPVESPLTPAALDALFDDIDGRLDSDIRFLGLPVRWRRMASNLVKLVAWLLVAAGLLLPVLVVGRATLPWVGERSGSELALIALMAGGLLLLADQLFNLSRSWQRLMMAQMRVMGIRQQLALEWQKRRPFVTDSGMATEGVALVELLAAAMRDNHQVMVTQKQAWADELDAALTELRGKLDQQRGTREQAVQAALEEAAKPTVGAINVAIDKPEDLQGEVRLVIDGKVAASWATPAAALSVGGVSPGLRSVQLDGKRKTPAGAEFHSGQSIEVKAGQAAAFAVKVV